MFIKNKRYTYSLYLVNYLMMNEKIKNLVLITLSILLMSCSSNKKDNSLVQLNDIDIYKSGLSSLANKNYNKAIENFDNLSLNHPFSSLVKKSEIMTAYSLYQNNEIKKSIVKLENFIEMNPKDEFTSYAHYLLAMNYYIQISNLGRDPVLSEKALNAFRLIIMKYPKSKYAKDAILKIQFIKNSLARNELNIGKFYLKKNAPASSIKRFKDILQNYQNTSVIPETLYRLTEALLMLGLKEEAIKSNALLKYNFPSDEWTILSDKILSNSVSFNKKEESNSFIKNYFKTIFD